MRPYIFDNNKTYPTSSSKTLNLAKVFGYCFIGLLITGIVAFGCGYLFNMWLLSGPESVTGIYAILIASSITLLVLTFVIQFVLLKGKHSLYVPSIIYAIVMGIVMSSLVMYIDWSTLGIAFLLTSLVFAIMTIIALISKSNMNGLAIVGSMLFIGAGIMGLFAWIFTLFLPIYNLSLYYILTFVVFIAVMLITMWDVKRITTICENGEMNNNLSLYCAFTIYTDFIYIFMRIALILAAFDRN